MVTTITDPSPQLQVMPLAHLTPNLKPELLLGPLLCTLAEWLCMLPLALGA